MSNQRVINQAVVIIALGMLVSLFGVQSTTGNVVLETEDSIDVRSASCNWNIDHYEVCSYVTWQTSGIRDTAKIVVSGSGIALGKAEKHSSSPLTSCVDAGTNDGRRSIQAYLLNSRDAYVDIDSDTIVYCKKDNREFDTVSKSASFRAKSINNRGRSQGTYEIRGFEGRPISCTFEGTYRTDDRLKLGGPRGHCHLATGQFSGFASGGVQYVINNADEFQWKGGGNRQLYDPATEKVDGYVAYMQTCDSSFYDQARYYVRAHVQEFTEEGLILAWEYFNEDSKPAVDFIFNVNCDIATENQPSVFPEIPEEPEEVVEDVVSPSFQEDNEEEVPAPEELKTKEGFWSRVKKFFQGLL